MKGERREGRGKKRTKKRRGERKGERSADEKVPDRWRRSKKWKILDHTTGYSWREDSLKRPGDTLYTRKCTNTPSLSTKMPSRTSRATQIIPAGRTTLDIVIPAITYVFCIIVRMIFICKMSRKVIQNFVPIFFSFFFWVKHQNIREKLILLILN